MPELKPCTQNFSTNLCGTNVVIDPQSAVILDADCIMVIGQVGTGAPIATGVRHETNLATRFVDYGQNSMLNNMIDEVLRVRPNAKIFAFPLANSGTPSVADIQVQGVDSAANNGSRGLWVNGNFYTTGFTSGTDTNITVAAALGALITTGDPTLTVTVAGDTITITTNILGEIGGQLNVYDDNENRPDLNSSDETSLNIVNTPGSGSPADIVSLSSATGTCEFIVNPYNDLTSLEAVADHLCQFWSTSTAPRAYGHFALAYVDHIALTQNANNALMSYSSFEKNMTVSYITSANYAAEHFNRLNSSSNEISHSLSGIQLNGIVSPEVSTLPSLPQMNDMIVKGAAVLNVDNTKNVTIGRSVTTYTTDTGGGQDLSLRDTNIPSILAFLKKDLTTKVNSRFANHAVRNDNIIGSASSKILTTDAVVNYLTSLYQVWSDRNLVQNIPDLIVNTSVTILENGCIQIDIDPDLVRISCCMIINVRSR